MSTRALVLPILLAFSLPLSNSAQQLRELASSCVRVAPQFSHACVDGALAARGLLGNTGLLLGLGSEVPGSWGPLRRGAPKLEIAFRAAGLRARIPDLTYQPIGGSAEEDFLLTTMQGSIVLGVFEGFQVKPTAGGFLAVELIAQGNILFLPTARGLESRVGGFSLGTRLGLLRETFTLPGIAISISRGSIGPLSFDWMSDGYNTAVEIEPSVTSARVTIGKDLSLLGLMGGAGLDSYNSQVKLSVLSQGNDLAEVAAPLILRRPVLFSSISLSLLILQLSTEFGWAWGLPMLEGYSLGPFDPTRGSVFLSLGARLTIR